MLLESDSSGRSYLHICGGSKLYRLGFAQQGEKRFICGVIGDAEGTTLVAEVYDEISAVWS